MRRRSPLAAFVLATAGVCACSSFGDATGAPGAGDAGASSADGASASAYAAVVLADGPLAYWRLGEKAAATIAEDASGHARSGVYVDCTLDVPGAIAGDVDTAASFDGERSSISVLDGFDFTGAAPFSVEAWVKPREVTTGFRHIVTQEWFAPGRQGFALLLDGGRLAFERFVDGDNAKAIAPVPAPPVRYTHVVGVYDGQRVRLYLDGAEVAREDAPGDLPAHESSAVLGAAAPSFNVVDGAIDEIAVYAGALTPERIAAHAMAGRAP